MRSCIRCGHKLKKKEPDEMVYVFRVNGYVCSACGLELSYRKKQMWYGCQKKWTGMIEVPEGCLLVFDKPL